MASCDVLSTFFSAFSLVPFGDVDADARTGEILLVAERPPESLFVSLPDLTVLSLCGLLDVAHLLLFSDFEDCSTVGLISERVAFKASSRERLAIVNCSIFSADSWSSLSVSSLTSRQAFKQTTLEFNSLSATCSILKAWSIRAFAFFSDCSRTRKLFHSSVTELVCRSVSSLGRAASAGVHVS